MYTRQVVEVSGVWGDELETEIMVRSSSYCYPTNYYPIAPIPSDETAIMQAIAAGNVDGWYWDGRYLMLPAGELHVVIRELMKLGEDAYDFATAMCATLSIEVY